MCGIVGYLGVRQPGLLGRMCDAVFHRGPDSGGMIEMAGALGLGMRRLAVIDPASGEQPMVACGGQVALVFNGEIYNYREVREELIGLGLAFRTDSDTEVVLNAYLAWGSGAWERLHGMFAIALADHRGGEPVLRLVRDRVGIKPLYYIAAGKVFVFASELKALTHWDGFDRSIDPSAVTDYLALRYVPGPGGLFRAVRKAPPGAEMTVREGSIAVTPYWRPPTAGCQAPAMSEAEAVRDFGDALRAAVRRHMIADVPVGAFLSGGIDSNVIVALMAEVGSSPVRTFSIGFSEAGDDDLTRAAVTAKALGTRHTEILCGVEDFLSLPDIACKLDEPVGDPIVVPMYALAREARKAVTVVLSGEGADEILGGYMFHRKIVQLDRMRRMLPGVLWPMVAGVVGMVPPALLDRVFDYPGALGTAGRAKIARLLRGLRHDDLGRLYRSAITLFDDDDLAEAGVKAAAPAALAAGGEGSVLQRLIGLQYAHWLPDDILMKSDKMTMAHSLEGRVPFMDDLVIQAAARLPDAMKFRHGTNKWVLRAFARGLLPQDIVEAPKRAFYAPFDAMMREPRMGAMMRQFLDPVRIARRGLVRPDYVQRLLAGQGEGGFLVEKRLFSILMLELWFEQFAPDASFG